MYDNNHNMLFPLEGRDFTLLNRPEVIFPAGSWSAPTNKCIVATLLDDEIAEPVEDFVLCLNATQSGVEIITHARCVTVNITDNDVPGTYVITMM